MRSEKKQLLIITSTFPRWEGDTDPPFVFDLCNRIKNKYSIHVLCPHASGTNREESLCGIHIKRFRYFLKKCQTLAYEGGILNRLRQNHWRYTLVPFFILGELIAIIQLLFRQRFNIINAHWLIPQGLVAICAKAFAQSSTPLVCTLHGGDIFALNGRIMTRLKRFVLSRTSAIIVVSQAMRQRVVSLGADREKVHVIPMGIDLKNTFIPPGTARREKSLLFVGRFVEKKGLRYLIEALSLVLLKHPQAHLRIVGHGPEETDLKQLLSSLHLNEKVNFLGGIENSSLPSIYQSAEIVIFPSIIDAKGDMEGFGLVIVEALGCECAVIASDLPAIHDIIIDNKTGLIVEQKNVQQIAHKIIYLLDHPDIKHSLGKEGRRYVLDRYDYEITARKYCDLFKELESKQ